MAWNNGFPATYQQTFPQGYPMTQNAAYAQQMAQAAFQQPNMTQQMPGTQMSPANQPSPMMTPPTIRAEIIQIDDEGWENYVDRFPLGPGASQMFMTRSEGNIIIKSMGQTGPLPLVVFDKRPPEPPAPTFDPEQYMRRDEVEQIIKDKVEMLVSAALATQQSEQATRTASVAARRASKKEDE